MIPEDLKPLTEEEKQVILIDELDTCLKRVVGEYKMTQISIDGSLSLFQDGLRAEWRNERLEEQANDGG